MLFAMEINCNDMVFSAAREGNLVGELDTINEGLEKSSTFLHRRTQRRIVKCSKRENCLRLETKTCKIAP